MELKRIENFEHALEVLASEGYVINVCLYSA